MQAFRMDGKKKVSASGRCWGFGVKRRLPSKGAEASDPVYRTITPQGSHGSASFFHFLKMLFKSEKAVEKCV